ncbi:MAG: histidine kinase [Polyangiaceae bacterium]
MTRSLTSLVLGRWMPEHAPMDLDAPDEVAFEAYARAVTARNALAMGLLIGVLSVVSLAVDPLVFGHLAAAADLRALRLVHLGALAAAYAIHRWTPLRRSPTAVMAGATIVGVAAVGVFLGRAGGLDAPWIHCSYPVLSWALVPVVGLGRRVAYGLAIAASLFCGFAFGTQAPLARAWIAPTTTFVVLLTAAAVVAGDVIFRLVQRGFLAGRRAARGARALADLGATLDARVRAQTSELRRLVHVGERAREDERTRVARELHDELGQELTALRYALTFLKQRYAKQPGSIDANLEELEALVMRAASTTRHVVSQLRPAALDHVGLAGGAEALLHDVVGRADLEHELVTSGDLDSVHEDVATAAFRILQESLTNVVRHSRARRVSIELHAREASLDLRVADDGIGFSIRDGNAVSEDGAADPSGGTGVGLIGIRERAGALSGVAKFSCGEAGGAVVEVSLPLRLGDVAP